MKVLYSSPYGYETDKSNLPTLNTLRYAIEQPKIFTLHFRKRWTWKYTSAYSYSSHKNQQTTSHAQLHSKKHLNILDIILQLTGDEWIFHILRIHLLLFHTKSLNGAIVSNDFIFRKPYANVKRYFYVVLVGSQIDIESYSVRKIVSIFFQYNSFIMLRVQISYI